MEIEQRQRPQAKASRGRPNRKKHPLSELIHCSVCGSNYTISGTDYYRCADQKERGTCGNTVSVRREPLEHATVAVFRHSLFSPEHARAFAEEFALK
ncbi:hypothetical protein ASE86_14555 [Sphingomonas sp. Leaf33]|nr:hypothetical protein ASE86_14555 [Sphingomonas sp. Leaf33]